jgi:hypothetical protein
MIHEVKIYLGSLGFEVFEPKMSFLQVLAVTTRWGEQVLAMASYKPQKACVTRLLLA